MPHHPALTAGRAAVITGASSGIGLAAARRFASMGLKVCLADLPSEALERAAAEVAAAAPAGRSAVLAVPTDVSKLEQVQALKDRAYVAFGEVAVLMNNAGTALGGGPWDHIERWRRVLEVNLWGSSTACRRLRPPCWRRSQTAPSSTPAPSRASPARPATPPTTSARPA